MTKLTTTNSLRAKMIQAFGEDATRELETAAWEMWSLSLEKEPVVRYAIDGENLLAWGRVFEVSSLPLYIAEERCPGKVRLAKGEYSGGSERGYLGESMSAARARRNRNQGN